jgi:hypothetical protein
MNGQQRWQMFGIVVVLGALFAWMIHLTTPDAAPVTKTEKLEAHTSFYSIKAAYPDEKCDKVGAMKQYVTQLVDARKQSWSATSDAYKEELKLRKQFPDRPKMKYELNVTFEKSTNATFGTISYLFNVYEFTGGANGQNTVASFTWDKNGAVDLQSILSFANNNDILLTQMIRSQAILSYPGITLSDIQQLDQGLGLAFLDADGVTLNKAKCKCDGYFYGSNAMNFMLKDDGITFAYNEYAILPGSYGAPTVTLSWDAVQPLLVATK